MLAPIDLKGGGGCKLKVQASTFLLRFRSGDICLLVPCEELIRTQLGCGKANPKIADALAMSGCVSFSYHDVRCYDATIKATIGNHFPGHCNRKSQAVACLAS